MTGKDAVQGGIDIDAWRKRIRDDTFANYHVEMGLALQGTGDAAAAVAAFERAVAITLDDVRANYGLTTSLLQLGRSAEAELAHRKALEHAPDYQAQAMLAQAYALVGTERILDAARILTQILQLKPDCLEGQELLNYVRLAEGQQTAECPVIDERPACERLAALGHPYMRLAWRFAREHRIPETMVSFEQAVRFQPSLIDHINNVGMIYCMSGQAARLTAVLEALVRRVDRPPQAWNWLGQFLLILGRLDEAMEAHRRALGIDERDPAALSSVGNLLQARGSLEEAAEWYDRAKQLRPNDIWLLSGQSLLEIALGRPERGMMLQREVLQLYPGSRAISWLGTNLALVEQANGQMEAAWASHRRAIAAEPHLIGFHAGLRPWALNDLLSTYKALDFDTADPRYVATIVASF